MLALTATVPWKSPWGVNYGGGVNSTALLVAAERAGLRPDWVLFADTGSERPETYANVDQVSRWCERVGFPFETVRWIRKDGTFESIHENCLRTRYLPSKAYGLAGCTYKWKIQPMQRWRKEHGFDGGIVSIGYDAGESRRIEKAKAMACADEDRGANEEMWYPLVAWRMDRAACVAMVREAGFATVKSSCFLCPNMKPAEWVDLSAEHPALYAVAREVDDGAARAGNAQTASLFRTYDPAQTCFCFADGGAC